MKVLTGRTLALAFVAGTLALATPDPASAQQRRGGGMFGGGEAMMLWGRLDQSFDEFAGTLSLTEAQKQLVTIVADDFREANADPLARLTAMREELRGMFGGGSRPDRQAMQQIVQKHGNPAQATGARPRNAQERRDRRPRPRAGAAPDPFACPAASAGGVGRLPPRRPQDPVCNKLHHVDRPRLLDGRVLAR